jgi:Helix-turn-helix
MLGGHEPNAFPKVSASHISQASPIPFDIKCLRLSHSLRRARRDTNRWRKRNKLRLTQKLVAKHLGMRRPYLSRIESGKADVSFLDVERRVYFYGLKSTRDIETLSREDKKTLHFNMWG